MHLIHTFCMPDDELPGCHEIQWQFPKFTISCISIDLRFVQAILGFVAETRDNPTYRDTSLGGGRYRYIDEKLIDLSQYFQGVRLRLEKLGESDYSYFLRFDWDGGSSLVVGLRTAEETDSFVDGIGAIEDEFGDSSEA